MESIATLTPYSNNARTHSVEQIQQIVQSIQEFGFTNPVLIDGQRNIIAGHGRIIAAKQLGMQTVPVVRVEGLSEEQQRALVIADNKIALNAGWDEILLIEELKALGDSVALTGFSEDELIELLKPKEDIGLTDPDAVPEPPPIPITQPGDLWVLGKHRLMCGDSTRANDVEVLLDGVSPELMVTDPPYGVDYNPKWRVDNPALVNKGGTKTGKVENDNQVDWSGAFALFGGNVIYCWHNGLFAPTVSTMLTDNGFIIRSQIIWVKIRAPISRGHYHWQHEPCFYAVKKNATANWHGDRKQSTVWSISEPKDGIGNHGTRKPVECMRRPIENNSSPGQAIYEPFSGSGTTIIAAEQSGRACYAMEISPAYCDVAVQRWEAFTGEKAHLINHTQQDAKSSGAC